MTAIVKEWVEKAEGDYRVALLAFRAKRSAYDAVCFHAQQCIEKYLKAALQAHGLRFSRTHDLGQLYQLGRSLFSELSIDIESLSELTSYAVEYRYPGYRAGKQDARDSVAHMKHIRSVLRALLKKG